MDPNDVSQPNPPAAGETDGRSDLRVVLQFFIVPLSLVVVLVSVFFGLQVLRSRRPDPGSALRSLESYDGLLARYVGDVKRWQSGYDLSLLLRAEDQAKLAQLVPDLTAAFREAGTRGDLKLRRYLVLALGHAADPRGAAALREGLADPDPQTRLFSTWGLMRVGGPAACADLRKAVGDSDPGVRKMAIFALGRLGDGAAVPAVRAALEDPEADVRWNAALALARLGDPTAAPLLIGLLDAPPLRPARPATGSDGADLMLNAIRGLALLRAPAGRAPLERLAESSVDPGIREAARLALDAYAAPAPEGQP
jgi:HEAT repeat protein